eukprot:14367535-Ditylum_brightwellii.AAC.1
MFQRSENHLDYIFVTLAIIPALRLVGFLPFNVPFLTDHGSMFVDFVAEALLQGVSNNLTDATRQNLITNNPICCD